MKSCYVDLPSGNSPKIIFLVGTTLTILILFHTYHPLSFMGSSYNSSTDSTKTRRNQKCDIFTGEWIPDSSAPYYTNETCWAIEEQQNCMKYGRPDLDFMKWRWKPKDCELPLFNPYQFLELVRGKSLAFVGDSVARNQMQSLICLLSRVPVPVAVSYSTDEKSSRWRYAHYNFTIENFWTPFLVKEHEVDPKNPALGDLFNLYLDEINEKWTTKIEEFDYVIISAGHWFLHPSMYYENKQLIGCYYCHNTNVTDISIDYAYGKAFRAAFRAINSLKNYKGITVLRTFAPSHFENGLWNKGGDCVRRTPFMSNETRLKGKDLKLYMAQLKEFRVAEQEGAERGLRFVLLDATRPMLMRPDGHPSRYGHWPEENVTLYRDCVHWCLPGPIDTWNDFLLQLLRVEANELLH